MSASFYDLQKFAATGIASPEMTHFDKMRALAMAGGTVQTLTGVPPLSFRANGKPLISLSMLGNGQQTGTPSPQSIIMPEFVGDKTKNLSPDTTVISSRYNVSVNSGALFNAFKELEVGKTYTMTWAYRSNGSGGVTNQVRTYSESSTPGVYIKNGTPFTWTQEAKDSFYWLNFYFGVDNTDGEMTNFMLVSGSTAPPYEPYGWTIPITCAGQTTPVYLGEVPTVRNIYKLVLTGNEGWGYTSGMHRITISENLYKREIERIAICSHYEAIENQPSASIQNNQLTFLVSSSGNNYMYIRDTRFDNTDDFKAYLAAQYAAGTPVCIWYVLAEPETEIVNEPLAKIGDYADELHITDGEVTIPTMRGQNTLTVETELQTSEMTITYTR